MIYMIVWTGGYELPGIAVTGNKDEAYKIAASWKDDADKESDSIAILAIDGVEAVEAGRLGLNTMDVIL